MTFETLVATNDQTFRYDFVVNNWRYEIRLTGQQENKTLHKVHISLMYDGLGEIIVSIRTSLLHNKPLLYQTSKDREIDVIGRGYTSSEHSEQKGELLKMVSVVTSQPVQKNTALRGGK